MDAREAGGLGGLRVRRPARAPPRAARGAAPLRACTQAGSLPPRRRCVGLSRCTPAASVSAVPLPALAARPQGAQPRRAAPAPVLRERLLVHAHRLLQPPLLHQRVALARQRARNQLVIGAQLAAALHGCARGRGGRRADGRRAGRARAPRPPATSEPARTRAAAAAAAAKHQRAPCSRSAMQRPPHPTQKNRQPARTLLAVSDAGTLQNNKTSKAARHACPAPTLLAVGDARLEVALLKVHRGAVGEEGHVAVVQLQGAAGGRAEGRRRD